MTSRAARTRSRSAPAPRTARASRARGAASPKRSPSARAALQAPATAARPPKPVAPKGRMRSPNRAQPDGGWAFVDGEVLRLQEARVPILDRGFLLGDGVFETMRVANGRIFRLDDHAARMADGLHAVGLSRTLEADFRDAAHRLVEAARKDIGDDLYLRIMVSTGPMEDLLGTGRGLTVTGIVRRFKPYPMQYYANGVSLIRSRQRKHTQDPLAAIKTLSFLPYVAARREAHAQTAHDGVLLNEHGRVVEASTSNLFAVRGGKVHAPGRSEGAIAGVTRMAVLELLEETGMEVVEPLEVSELATADEAFLTNTTGGVVPVTVFEDKPIGKGRRKGQKGELATTLGHALEMSIRGD